MPEVPECMMRRYAALDALIRELTTKNDSQPSSDPGVRLMCHFWNILKEDPTCKLSEEVQQCLYPSSNIPSRSSVFKFPTEYTCYMANDGPPPPPSAKPSSGGGGGGSGGPPPARSCNSGCAQSVPPLSQVLCNLKQAASVDKRCNTKLKELLAVEKHLRTQIAQLEKREKAGVNLMREADDMWSQMEESYKEKIAESLTRQKDLVIQLREIEQSAAKWRKNKKDLEAQLESINKCQLEIIGKINQKSNDVKAIEAEIDAFKKRIENTKKETEAAKKALVNRKAASDARVAIIVQEINKLQQLLQEETKKKQSLDFDGKSYTSEARGSLQKLCKTLLQKRLEQEDLKAEKNALIQEINLLKDTCNLCKEKCSKKEENIKDEIKKLNVEIGKFKVKCMKCHKCESTDSRRFCTDCPRCAERRKCITKDDTCTTDPKEECVCLIVKQKFLDNIFENMYSVLASQIKTKCGKVVGDQVVECLKKSRNGKLNHSTKLILRDFTLQAVKKNLNLTIVGGAVKTRCELDPVTYEQLMLCLKCVIPTPPPKTDQATDVKKDPCTRWGGVSECNCPKGPLACICTLKANAPPKDPIPCPAEPAEDNDDVMRDVCPHERSALVCGPDCGGRVEKRDPTDVSQFRPDSCYEKSCQFAKNMRAAQCVLGPEALVTPKETCPFKLAPYKATPVPEEKKDCDCGPTAPVSKPCKCKDICPRDAKQLKAGLAKDSPKESLKIGKTKTNTTINQMYKLEYPDQYDKDKKSFNEKCQQTQTEDTSKPLETGTDPVGTFANIDIQTKNMEQSVDYFVNLKNTSPGAMVMEMDETLIEILRKNAQRSKKIVYLRETSSKRYFIDFNHKDELPTAKFSVEHTVSGAILFEIDKNDMLNVQKLTFTNDVGVGTKSLSSSEVKNKISKSITNDEKKLGNTKQNFKSDKTKKTRDKKRIKRTLEDKLQKHFDEIILQNIEDIKMIHICKKNEANVDETKSVERFRKELQLFYEQNFCKIIVNVYGENGKSALIEGNITKTSSGNVALDIKKLNDFGELSYTVKERPILLNKSASGIYNLFFSFQSGKDSQAPNSVLRRTSSGGLLIVVTEPLSAAVSLKRKANLSLDNLFKVKVIGITSGVKLPPAILKMSPSHNYDFVLDKEFEKQHTEWLNSSLDDYSECFVELRKTNSVISINFDKNCKKNALLVKFPSQNIRVLVNGPVFENRSSKKATNSFSKQFENCMRQMPAEHKNKKISEIIKSDIRYVKSSSDSHFYKGLRGKDNVFDKTSAKLRRTESGQYAAILDREIKKSFINELKKHLAQSPHGLIPIKKTDSGEITIILNPDESESLQLGSLKITTSGNIYVVVDESIIENVENELDNNKKRISIGIGSEHMIKKNLNPEDKTTTTTCDRNEYVCEPAKCNSAHLRTASQQFKPFNKTAMKNTYMVLQNSTTDLTTRNKFSCVAKEWYPNKCENNFHKKEINIESEFCTKPYSCSSIPDCDPKTVEGFYVTPSFITNNDDHIELSRLKSSSGSGTSSSDEGTSGNNPTCTSEQRPDTIESQPPDTVESSVYKSAEGWDSFQYLPHQLPYFIRGFR